MSFSDTFDTVYFGGGTPSILETDELAEILESLRETFSFNDDTRIYLEANPEDVTPASCDAWQRLGINTLSLGVQSFDDDELHFLGRRHSGAEARQAVSVALAGNFDVVSVDLIYALPGRSAADWRSNLETVVELSPQHLSCYTLEIHERTTFGKEHARGTLAPLADDTQGDLLVDTHRFLRDAGLPGYEVSNFARAPEHRSRHNMKYWRHVPYLGLGVGAHSFDGQRRFWNERSLLRYSRALAANELPRAGEEQLTLEDRLLETLMLGLRTYDGLDVEQIQDDYGCDLLKTGGERLEALIRQGVLVLDGGRIKPTIEGLALADGMAAALAP